MWEEWYTQKIKAKVLSNAVHMPSGCLVWQRSCSGGYPQIGGRFNGKAWIRRVHLLVWEWAHGEVPLSFYVGHSCQERKCVAVEHLQLISAYDQTQAAQTAQMKPTRDTDIARFMEKVEKQPSGCWIWTATPSLAGTYGLFWLDGQNMGSHCASVVLFHKKSIPKKMVVMHSCDDRTCVNPDHLSVGTYKENMEDMIQKGRDRSLGSRNTQAKLTEAQVLSMRAEYVDRPGEIMRLSAKYQTSPSDVSGIIYGKSWKHISVTLGTDPFIGPVFMEMPPKGEIHHRAKITEDQVREIRQLAAQGLGPTEIAAKFGLRKAQTSQIIRGKAWSHVV